MSGCFQRSREGATHDGFLPSGCLNILGGLTQFKLLPNFDGCQNAMLNAMCSYVTGILAGHPCVDAWSASGDGFILAVTSYVTFCYGWVLLERNHSAAGTQSLSSLNTIKTAQANSNPHSCSKSRVQGVMVLLSVTCGAACFTCSFFILVVVPLRLETQQRHVVVFMNKGLTCSWHGEQVHKNGACAGSV